VSANTTGRGRKVTPEELEQEIRNADQPVVTATELSSSLPITNAHANRMLKQLAQDDTIQRKKVGSAAVVYWHPDRLSELLNT
jgi:predicted transcriptional regulator